MKKRRKKKPALQQADEIEESTGIAARTMHQWRKDGRLRSYVRLPVRGRPWIYDPDEIREVAKSLGIYVP